MEQVTPTSSKGIFKSLYDFKFARFVTSKVVRVPYFIITILDSLAAVVFFIAYIRRGGVGVLIAIIGVPLAYFLSSPWPESPIEFIIVVFRIGEDVRPTGTRE